MKAGIRILLTMAVLGLPAPGSAQELSPRSYWPAPKGTRVFILGYNHSTGDIVTDPSLPVVGVDSTIDTFQLGYLHTLSLFGRTSNLIVQLPYTQGTTRGTLEGQAARRDVSGVGDLTITLSANILGAPTMTPEGFAELRRNPRPIVGASVRLLAPTGQYETDRLINVGANRWAVKAELGAIFPMKPRWLLEFEAGAWYFGDNDEFLGVTREQSSIVSAEVHMVKRFRPGFWAALDLNYYTGGRTTVDGEERADLQRNSRIGATVVWPFRKRHAIKAGYSVGVVTESGGDFRMFLLAYQTLL